MAITGYSFKSVQARSQQKETLILDEELNLYRTLKNIIPCYCAVNMRVTIRRPEMKKIAKQNFFLITE